MNGYYISKAGDVEPEGPYTVGQVVAMWNNGALKSDAQICEEGTGEWQELKYKIHELHVTATKAGELPKPAVIPPPAPMVAGMDVKQAKAAVGGRTWPKKGKKSVKPFENAVVVVFILAAATALVPALAGFAGTVSLVGGAVIFLLGIVLLAKGAVVNGLVALVMGAVVLPAVLKALA